jgi:hypothetical protein
MHSLILDVSVLCMPLLSLSSLLLLILIAMIRMRNFSAFFFSSSSRSVTKLMNFKEQSKYVKDRVVLSELISRYRQLTPAGSNSYKCQCLFHNDSNPSMIVNDATSTDTAYYYCFGCGESGDFIKFLAKKADIPKGAVLAKCYDALVSGKPFYK